MAALVFEIEGSIFFISTFGASLGGSFFSGNFASVLFSCSTLGASEIPLDSSGVFTAGGIILSNSIPRMIITMGPLIIRINLFFEMPFDCVWVFGVTDDFILGLGGALCVAPTSIPNS